MTTDTRPAYGTRRSLRAAILVSSIVSLLFGLAILAWPVKSAIAITIVVAIYAIIAGIADVGLAVTSRGMGGWTRAGLVVLGLLFIAAGIAAFTSLGTSTLLLAVFVTTFLGIAWIVDGILALFSLGHRDTAWPGSQKAHRGWTIAFAIISILAGIAVVLSPLVGALWLWILLGIALIVFGVTGIVRAATLER